MKPWERSKTLKLKVLKTIESIRSIWKGPMDLQGMLTKRNWKSWTDQLANRNFFKCIWNFNCVCHRRHSIFSSKICFIIASICCFPEISFFKRKKIFKNIILRRMYSEDFLNLVFGLMKSKVIKIFSYLHFQSKVYQTLHLTKITYKQHVCLWQVSLRFRDFFIRVFSRKMFFYYGMSQLKGIF